MPQYKTSLLEIKLGYRRIKKLAENSLNRQDYPSFVKHLNKCVTIASQINWRYCDDDLEDMLFRYAKSTIYEQIDNNEYIPNPDHWVFYDDYCSSYVLALQWMGALTKLNKQILYITSEYSFDKRRSISILPEIEQMPNVSISVIPEGNHIKRANYLYKSLVDFRPSKVFLHKAMFSLINAPLCIFPKAIQTYNINLGDQFFWLGGKWINYNIEFRPFGASLSLQKRRLRREQLLMIPFYPANEHRPFQGFPSICKDRLVIFSGGDYYKTLDSKNTFWNLISSILKSHPNVTFIFATKRGYNCEKHIGQFIRRHKLENQFCHISFRQDIFQVFAHCDIYMGTSPVSGSLMSQLAAINGKPILQYYPRGTQDDETEQALCINKTFQISFDKKEDFLIEADRLIKDEEYRCKQGRRIAESMISESQFNDIVKQAIATNKSPLSYNTYRINNHRIVKRWSYQCHYLDSNIGNYIYSSLGSNKCALFIPSLFIKKNGCRLISLCRKR